MVWCSLILYVARVFIDLLAHRNLKRHCEDNNGRDVNICFFQDTFYFFKIRLMKRKKYDDHPDDLVFSGRGGGYDHKEYSIIYKTSHMTCAKPKILTSVVLQLFAFRQCKGFQTLPVPHPKIDLSKQLPIEDELISALSNNTANQSSNLCGVPWKCSLQENQPLTFMPYYEWTKGLLGSLSNLKQLPASGYNHIEKEDTARLHSESYESDEYRKIRMTYYDAGSSAQVFNSLWYPRSDLPLLGIDLLQFRNKFLVVVDFQPLQEKKSIQSISAFWPTMPDLLRGKMSNRFYDHDQYFSDHMLFGRFTKEEAIDLLEQEGTSENNMTLWHAFQTYVLTHIDTVQKCFFDDAFDEEKILELHKAYDQYSAERDPAHAMFKKVFGESFADGFVYDFLFDLAQQKKI